MNLRKFRRLLDSYGSDLARWPETARGPALDLCARSSEAAAMRAAEERFDAFLHRKDPAPASAIGGERLQHLMAAVEAELPRRRIAAGRPGRIERFAWIEHFARFLRTTPDRLRLVSHFAAPVAAAVVLGILAEGAIWPSSSDYSTGTSFPASVWTRGL